MEGIVCVSSQTHPAGRAYNAEDPRLRSFSVRVDQLAESAVSGTAQCGFESLRGHHLKGACRRTGKESAVSRRAEYLVQVRIPLRPSSRKRYNRRMTTPDEDREMTATAEKVLSYAGNPDSQRTAMLAAFRLFHSMGYRRGYSDAMDDAAKGKDRRVKAHLN